MAESQKHSDRDDEKPAVTLPGTVEKIIPPVTPSAPEKAQIAVEGADELYREIRVENTLQDGSGNDVSLKEGAAVEVTIEANLEGTTPKKDQDNKKSAQPNPPANRRKTS